MDTILSGIWGILRSNRRGTILYVLGLAVAGSFIDAMSYNSDAVARREGLLNLILSVVSIGAGYLLTESMLENAGQRVWRGGRRYFAYFLQGILILLAVLLGALLFIIPGLILSARWALAQPLLIGQGDGILASMCKSWVATEGYTATIIIAGMIVCGPPILASAALIYFLAADNLWGIVIVNFAVNALGASLIAMTVCLLKLINHRRHFANVFD